MTLAKNTIYFNNIWMGATKALRDLTTKELNEREREAAINVLDSAIAHGAWSQRLLNDIFNQSQSYEKQKSSAMKSCNTNIERLLGEDPTT